jgi:hypothetical protein
LHYTSETQILEKLNVISPLTNQNTCATIIFPLLLYTIYPSPFTGEGVQLTAGPERVYWLLHPSFLFSPGGEVPLHKGRRTAEGYKGVLVPSPTPKKRKRKTKKCRNEPKLKQKLG